MLLKLKSRSAVIAGLLCLVTGASAFALPQTNSADPSAARRISGEEAKQAVAKGEAVLVDVRGKEAYEAGHAKGAISLPVNEVPARAGELPKDKLIITYCT